MNQKPHRHTRFSTTSSLELEINQQTVHVCFCDDTGDCADAVLGGLETRALMSLDHVLRANPGFQEMHPEVQLEQVVCVPSLSLAQMGRFCLTYRDVTGVFTVLACLGANTMIDLYTQQIMLFWGKL